MAKATGMDITTITGIFLGRTMPKLQVALKMAKLMNMSVQQLYDELRQASQAHKLRRGKGKGKGSSGGNGGKDGKEGKVVKQ